MKSITAKGYKVEFTEKQYIILNEFLNSRQYSSVFVLADSNTEEHCLPLFLSNLSTESSIEIISIELERKTSILKPVLEFGVHSLSLVQIAKVSS